MILHISGKVSDMFGMTTDDGSIDYDGYVPHGIEIGGGDYINISIDMDTGKIVGWKPLTLEKLQRIVEAE